MDEIIPEIAQELFLKKCEHKRRKIAERKNNLNKKAIKLFLSPHWTFSLVEIRMIRATLKMLLSDMKIIARHLHYNTFTELPWELIISSETECDNPSRAMS